MTKTIEQLSARVAELEAENARLKAVTHVSLPTNTMEQWVASEIRRATLRIKEQLAATQAEIKRLREQIMIAIGSIPHEPKVSIEDTLCKAIAQPSDTSALDQLRAADQLEIKRMRDVLERIYHTTSSPMSRTYAEQALTSPTDTSALARLRAVDQLGIKRMRKALVNLRWAASERDKKNRIRQFDQFIEEADAAIISPADTSALDAYVAEKVKEAMK